MDTESQLIVWDTVSMAWTEIGLEADDYPKIAERLRARSVSWPEIRRVSLRDVCGSFAFDTFLIFPCMLWMIMPDWGYSEDYLKERIKKWHSKPLWVHFLNPLRLLGYPLALIVSVGVRSKLKVAFNKAGDRA